MDRVNLVLSHQKGCVTWPESILFLMCHICWSWLAIRHGGSKSSLTNVDLNCVVANCPFVVKIKLLWKIVTQFYCSVMITSRSLFSIDFHAPWQEKQRREDETLNVTSGRHHHIETIPKWNQDHQPTRFFQPPKMKKKNPCKDMNQKIPH